MRIVIVCGKFDPLHQGHVEHIKQAASLGDFIIVITHPDKLVEKYSTKGFCAIPYEYRAMLLRGLLKELNTPGKVVMSVDQDGTITKTLKEIHDSWGDLPIILAKGGDRTPENMPINEVLSCQELGIEIRYGIGKLLNSSSKIMQVSKR